MAIRTRGCEAQSYVLWLQVFQPAILVAVWLVQRDGLKPGRLKDWS